MSEEKGNTPTEWANKVIGLRYNFSNTDKQDIYDLIDAVW
jgi:hypothetical protein